MNYYFILSSFDLDPNIFLKRRS
uniref:Uncharacterized protein n=1 Tax=Arundo donax TaxID=35708 RepID=A0A0A8YMI2_ARUDO